MYQSTISNRKKVNLKKYVVVVGLPVPPKHFYDNASTLLQYYCSTTALGVM